MNSFEWFIAWRYLWSRRREGFITIITGFSFLGICLGVATLIVVMSVMNGFRHELSQKILDFNSHLSLYDHEENFSDYKNVISDIQHISGVNAAIPVIEGQALLTAQGKSFGVMVRALPFEDLIKRMHLFKKNLFGDFSSFQQESVSIALGARLAERLKISLGSPVTLISPDGNITPFGTMPRLQTFKVSTIFEAGMYEYDSAIVFIPFQTAQKFFQVSKGISHIELFLNDPYNTEDISHKIQTKISRPLMFISWHQAHASFFEVVKIERNVMFIILSLIILIAAFNIISGLVMLVKDKTQDIAILKTIGTSHKSIMNIFCIVGSSIGILGTFGGIGLGLLVASYLENIRQFLQVLTNTKLFDAEFYFLSELPVIINPLEILGISLMAIVLSFLATLYPAWRASRLNPVEALRYE